MAVSFKEVAYTASACSTALATSHIASTCSTALAISSASTAADSTALTTTTPPSVHGGEAHQNFEMDVRGAHWSCIRLRHQAGIRYVADTPYQAVSGSYQPDTA